MAKKIWSITALNSNRRDYIVRDKQNSLRVLIQAGPGRDGVMRCVSVTGWENSANREVEICLLPTAYCLLPKRGDT